jgi:excisionase family DNA binding protein
MGASVDRRSAPIAELLSVNDAVDLFGKSERTIRRWIANGTLKVFRVGHSVFIPSDHIRELISASMLSGTPPRAETK